MRFCICTAGVCGIPSFRYRVVESRRGGLTESGCVLNGYGRAPGEMDGSIHNRFPFLVTVLSKIFGLLDPASVWASFLLSLSTRVDVSEPSMLIRLPSFHFFLSVSVFLVDIPLQRISFCFALTIKQMYVFQNAALDTNVGFENLGEVRSMMSATRFLRLESASHSLNHSFKKSKHPHHLNVQPPSFAKYKVRQ